MTAVLLSNTPSSRFTFFVSLSSFILAVAMLECLGKHSNMSSTFLIATLNGTSFFSASATTTAQCVFGAKCIWIEMYSERNVFGSKCIRNEMYSDRNVFGTKCIRIEVYSERNVFGSKCIRNEMYSDRSVFGAKCIRIEVYSERNVLGAK